ncbi:protein ECERIFERUM 26-like [Papaver somniferum]|uniref:protein ECERIFERUM 26-like n=1 Tax=Papaver somniferum TaxID=3469 RepID=UPI000E701B46|nr:protein ECERIFERUM 26-like [Papaver somniferum]
MASSVSIMRKKTLGSIKEVEDGKFCNLSVLDRVMEPSSLRIVLYYQFPANTNFAKLKKKFGISISYTLSAFTIVVGRLIANPTPSEGHWHIKCNDDGVRTIEARANCSLEEWLMSVTREKELELIYWDEMPNNPHLWSAFYVQLTEFEEGGFSVGLSCAHLLADAMTATMFLKAWADSHLLRKIQSPPLFHPLPSRKLCSTNTKNHELHFDLINQYKSSIESISNPITASKSEEYSTITFAFSDEMVRKCIFEMSSDSSPFAALAALFWVCISKVKGRKEGLINMCVCLDMRNVLGLGKDFFGNCMVFNKVSGDIEVAEKEAGLANAARAMQSVVGEMEEKERIMDLIEWLKKNTGTHRIFQPINGNDVICAGIT